MIRTLCSSRHRLYRLSQTSSPNFRKTTVSAASLVLNAVFCSLSNVIFRLGGARYRRRCARFAGSAASFSCPSQGSLSID